MRTAVGFLFMLSLFMLFGCTPTFTQSRETCLGKVDSPKEAIKLVMPHLTQAMTCAADHIEDEPAALACITAQGEAMKSAIEPVALQCGLALIGDAVTAGKK